MIIDLAKSGEALPTEFAFIASHDLNEPLRKIQTFGSFLEAKESTFIITLPIGKEK